MEVILKQDVEKLGYANDIVNVKNGYARNYLFPKQKAIPATETNKKIIAEKIKQKAFKAEKIKQEAEDIGAKLDGATIKIGTKASEKGTIFGSVTNVQIAEAIQEQLGVTIERRKISIQGEAIKELGNYTAKVDIHEEVKSEIYLEVIAE